MKCTLRPWKETDIDNLVKFANNYNIAKNLTDTFPHPYTQQDGMKFITTAIQMQPTRLFAIDVNGEAVGSVGIFPQTDIHAKKCGNGLYAFGKVLGTRHYDGSSQTNGGILF